jgi:cytohesin
MSAAEAGDVSEMKAAIADKADVNTKNESGVTPLWKAAYAGQPGAVQYLLSAGADPKTVDNAGDAPIMVTDSPDIVASLASAGADVNARDRGQWTVVYRAVAQNKPDKTRALITAGADVNAPDQGGVTPLMVASLQGHAELVQMLLDAGADPNVRSQGGETALHLASDDEIRTLLRAHGATG